MKKAIDTYGRPNPFKDNMPGNRWFSAFMVRNPPLSFRKPQGIGIERAIVTPGRVDRWFSDLESHLAEHRVTSILYDGRGMFNCDESGFALAGSTGNKVLAEKGSNIVPEMRKVEECSIAMRAALRLAAVLEIKC